MKMRLTFAVFFFMALLPAPAAAEEYSCADKIISRGDTSATLLSKCGEPDWKQSHIEEIAEKDEEGDKQKTIISVEEWTYNLGPDRLTRIFELRNGTVTDVRSGGYGVAKERLGLPGCGDRVISVGDRAADLTAKCGQPDWKDSREEIIQKRVDENTVRKVTVRIEDWTYDFGPDRLKRIFTIRNGTITDIRTGNYGE